MQVVPSGGQICNEREYNLLAVKCLASLQGLEGEGGRVPGACDGVWGEISIFQPSGSQVAATAPVG